MIIELISLLINYDWNVIKGRNARQAVGFLMPSSISWPSSVEVKRQLIKLTNGFNLRPIECNLSNLHRKAVTSRKACK